MRTEREITILAIAFGTFPGVRINPSLALVRSLAPIQRARSAGVRIETLVLPVTWDEVSTNLLEAIERLRPDVVLLIGVASRRRQASVEARSLDRRSILRPDAAKCIAARRSTRTTDDPIRRARVPAARLVVAMRRAGAPTAISIDAGDYLCNAALDAALGTAVPLVGFVHVPRLRDLFAPIRRSRARGEKVDAGFSRPTIAELSAAIRAALSVLVVELRRLKHDPEKLQTFPTRSCDEKCHAPEKLQALPIEIIQRKMDPEQNNDSISSDFAPGLSRLQDKSA